MFDLSAIEEIAFRLQRFSVNCDIGTIHANEIEGAIQAASVLSNRASNLVSMLSARSAELSVWQNTDARSPAHYVAKLTGSTLGQAIESLETQSRMKGLNLVQQACLNG